MSGIVGILNTDRAPVDRELLSKMTGSLAARGPDAQSSWHGGNVGLGHTAFWTCDISRQEKQPATLDGEVWLTANARIDAREDLVPALRSHGCDVRLDSGDAELILHAYQVWGTGCPKHLLGDFAFALWDGRKQQLFCARDHLGVKRFFYSSVGNHLVVSNSIRTILLHVAVPDTLDDLAVAEFILFGSYSETSRSIYAHIRRLSPACTLVWNPSGLKIEKYWEPAVGEEIHYQRARDYPERLLELLKLSVKDRLRGQKAGILMSGGLDSTSVAAVAKEVVGAEAASEKLAAVTIVYDRLMPDQERRYAGLAAKHLGIPIKYVVADDFDPFQDWDKPELQTDEPANDPLTALWLSYRNALAGQSRIALSGEGGDELLRTPQAHFPNLIRSGRLDRWCRDVITHYWYLKQRPSFGIKTLLRRARNKDEDEIPTFPNWIDRDMAKSWHLYDKWRKWWDPFPSAEGGAPDLVARISSAILAQYLESFDSEIISASIDFRFPILDRRIIDYLAEIPAFPWHTRKLILRESVVGLLPNSTRLRRKAPLAQNSMLARSGNMPMELDEILHRNSEMNPYLNEADLARTLRDSANLDVIMLCTSLRAVAFGLWRGSECPQAATANV